MRLRLDILIIIICVAAVFVLSRLYAFIQLFFEHSGIAITQGEIASAYDDARPNSRLEYIPQIIHQIYHDWHNESIPLVWDELRKTCSSLNPGWEYKLWTDATSREFISTHYHWFLSTYDGYVFPIQRVDTLRYFLLLHYGGVYIDLDNVQTHRGCLENLAPLLYYPTWTTDGGRGALSNNILGSQPNHPFWKLLTDSLISYNYNYFFPYITISYASGQWFETAIWQKYHYAVTDEKKLHRIMMDSRPGANPSIFFTQVQGETWRNWDNYIFLWIGDHLVLTCIGVAFMVGLSGWIVTRCLTHRSLYPIQWKEKIYSRSCP